MPTTVRRLIETAAETLGSDVRLAERLGVSRQRVWEWKDGRRPMPMGRIQHVAIIAGIDPDHAVALVAVERYRVGKRIAGLAIMAAAAFAFIPPNLNAAQLDNLHIMRSRFLKLIASLMRRDDRRSPFATCSQDA